MIIIIIIILIIIIIIIIIIDLEVGRRVETIQMTAFLRPVLEYRVFCSLARFKYLSLNRFFLFSSFN